MVIFLMFRTISSIKGSLSPGWRATKWRLHLLAITFYEACGYMISAQGQKGLQDRLTENLMALPNTAWDQIIAEANQNPAIDRSGQSENKSRYQSRSKLQR
jgi:hypothetical protein